MLKVLTVILVFVACCYCSDNVNEVLVEDARASKKRRNFIKLWAMILLFAFSKVAIFKVASFMFFFMIFQKLFTFGGILLSYFMKQKSERIPAPPTMYGPPGPPTSEYNTLGYSYGPPDSGNAHVENVYPGPEYGLPGLTDIGGSFNNWLYNKNP